MHENAVPTGRAPPDYGDLDRSRRYPAQLEEGGGAAV
jgi:hypothetical protein